MFPDTTTPVKTLIRSYRPVLFQALLYMQDLVPFKAYLSKSKIFCAVLDNGMSAAHRQWRVSHVLSFVILKLVFITYQHWTLYHLVLHIMVQFSALTIYRQFPICSEYQKEFCVGVWLLLAFGVGHSFLQASLFLGIFWLGHSLVPQIPPTAVAQEPKIPLLTVVQPDCPVCHQVCDQTRPQCSFPHCQHQCHEACLVSLINQKITSFVCRCNIVYSYVEMLEVVVSAK